MSVLAQRLLAINANLANAQIPHAFGGAIALAFCTGEPRATIDLDLNVFLSREDLARALTALPPEVTVSEANLRELEANGQARVWWARTPIDLFFNTHPFHYVAASRVREVPFAGHLIPVLDCTTLAVFKAFFNRTKDWADLEAMAEAGQLDTNAVGAFLHDLLGDDDRLRRLAELEDMG